ncbi:MAG: dethiobiotin synthase [Acidiferrobacteraceae bacterium]
MRYGWFVAGTDTGVGKTAVSAKLLAALGAGGIAAVGMKPVATGAEFRGGRLVADDAIRLIEASTVAHEYDDVNPYVYGPPVSPHLAAREARHPVRFGAVLDAFSRLAGVADAVVVEGTGGWLTPVDDRRTMEDLAIALRLPVVLVVGLRLGCISHTLLSHDRIVASGLPFQGWIANDAEGSLADPAPVIATLAARLGPELGNFPHDSALSGVLELPRFLRARTNPANV